MEIGQETDAFIRWLLENFEPGKIVEALAHKHNVYATERQRLLSLPNILLVEIYCQMNDSNDTVAIKHKIAEFMRKVGSIKSQDWPRVPVYLKYRENYKRDPILKATALACVRGCVGINDLLALNNTYIGQTLNDSEIDEAIKQKTNRFVQKSMAAQYLATCKPNTPLARALEKIIA